MADFEFYHAMGCSDVYIIHITTENFVRGTVNLRLRPHGTGQPRPVGLPFLGVLSPSLFIFPAVAVMDFFKIETKTCVKGLWFATDLIPPRHIVRRQARKMTVDWRGWDATWNLRPGIEGLEMGVTDDQPMPLALLAPRSPSPESTTPRTAETGTSPSEDGSDKLKGSDPTGSPEMSVGPDSGCDVDTIMMGGADDVGREAMGTSPDTLTDSPATAKSSAFELSPILEPWIYDEDQGAAQFDFLVHCV